MTSVFKIGLLGCVIFAFSCKPKMICPAYQSAFLLSDEVQDEYFSYFQSDSLPRESVSSNKSGNGISQGPTKDTYNKRHYNFPMKHVYTVEEKGDSLFGGTSATNIDNLDYDDLESDGKPSD